MQVPRVAHETGGVALDDVDIDAGVLQPSVDKELRLEEVQVDRLGTHEVGDRRQSRSPGAIGERCFIDQVQNHRQLGHRTNAHSKSP